MITLKEWNSLPQNKREKIASIVFNNMPEDMKRDLSKEFHHNFDWNNSDNYGDGYHYKIMLSCCYKQKDGSIKVTVIV